MDDRGMMTMSQQPASCLPEARRRPGAAVPARKGFRDGPASTANLPRLAAARRPEVAEMNFGFVPLTDCAPLVIAHEKGFFQKHGVTSTLNRTTSWTDLRDSLATGANHAAHMLFGMPVAAAAGRLGANQKPLVIPWILSRNGQAITLSGWHKGVCSANARALRSMALEKRENGRPMVFAMTHQTGTHAMWLRYWLAAGGIDPDKDVALITIPPPQMVKNMQIARMDGFCAGEPWPALAIAEGAGFTAITSQEIWPDHPEKVFAFTEEFIERNPCSTKAALKAVHDAGVWLDDSENKAEAAGILARPEYVGVPADRMLPRLQGSIDYGDGRTAELPGVVFSERNCNLPQPAHCIWWLSQMRRWGMLSSPPDYGGIARRVIRQDIHASVMAELGLPAQEPVENPAALFDGAAFDPLDPERYAASFKIGRVKN